MGSKFTVSGSRLAFFDVFNSLRLISYNPLVEGGDFSLLIQSSWMRVQVFPVEIWSLGLRGIGLPRRVPAAPCVAPPAFILNALMEGCVFHTFGSNNKLLNYVSTSWLKIQGLGSRSSALGFSLWALGSGSQALGIENRGLVFAQR